MKKFIGWKERIEIDCGKAHEIVEQYKQRYGQFPKSATVRTINTFIADSFPQVKVEFVKGNGYFYFVNNTDGAYNEPDSIYVYALSHMDCGKWFETVSVHIVRWIGENERGY